MHYIGIDLHKRSLTAAVEGERGPLGPPRKFASQEAAAVSAFFRSLRPFRAVIEASSSYRWLHDLLSPWGEVVLAHPLRLRAIVSGRAKTDKLDAKLLAKLLRAGLIPTAYVPPKSYAELRDLTRARARLVRRRAEAKNELHALLARANVHPPYVRAFGPRGRKWVQGLDLGAAESLIRDELLRRLEHYDRELVQLDRALEALAAAFPETQALASLPGVGLYSALLIVAEIGEPGRFPDGRKVAAYGGLTARVSQSGQTAHYGHITRQGSPWLRWILVQAAIKVIREDPSLRNFYTRIRKRSSAKIARVAVARKLATICWVRLMCWHREQAAAA